MSERMCPLEESTLLQHSPQHSSVSKDRHVSHTVTGTAAAHNAVKKYHATQKLDTIQRSGYGWKNNNNVHVLCNA